MSLAVDPLKSRTCSSSTLSLIPHLCQPVAGPSSRGEHIQISLASRCWCHCSKKRETDIEMTLGSSQESDLSQKQA